MITINFDNQLPTLDAAHLDRLIDLFLSDTARKRQRSTVKGYRFKLKPFIDWWRKTGPRQQWILGAADLADYVHYLESIEWGYNSRCDAVKRLRQMFRWAHRAGYVEIDFAIYLPEPRGSAPVKQPITLQQLAALLDACWRTSNPIRNRCIIATLAGTGLRREECASLFIEDVTMYADGCGFLQPRVTKNDKARLVAYDQATGRYLAAWLDILGAQNGPLFPSRNGGHPLTPDGLYKVVFDTAEIAGIDVQTHDFRRMFATMWSKKLRGRSYGQLLQLQLGHEDYNTTVIYSLQQPDDILQALRSQSVSPLAQLATSMQ